MKRHLTKSFRKSRAKGASSTWASPWMNKRELSGGLLGLEGLRGGKYFVDLELSNLLFSKLDTIKLLTNTLRIIYDIPMLTMSSVRLMMVSDWVDDCLGWNQGFLYI